MQEKELPNFYIRSGLFTVLSLLGAIINYATYPVLARILNITEFGDFSAVIAISNQTLGFLLAFNVISIHLVKKYPESTARQNAQVIQKVLIWIFLALSALIVLLFPVLKHSLKINDPAAFLVLGLILVVSVPGSIWTGYLQGHKEMIRIGWYSFSVAVTKLIGTVLLALAAGVLGGLWGFLLGMIAGLIILRYLPGVKLPGVSAMLSGLTKLEKNFLKSTLRYIAASVLVVGSLVALQNIDIVMAKLMFDPDIAGRITGISVLSNALYYVLFLIIWIVLPEIEIGNSVVNRRILFTSYKLIFAVLVAVIGVELLMGETVIKILLGETFSGQRDVLIFASLFRITLISITLYAFYLLVVKRFVSLLLAMLTTSFSLIIPYIFANSEVQMIAYLWLSLLLGVVVYGTVSVVYKRVSDAKQEI